MKTEREKMLCGEFYDTRDHELRALSSNAKDLTRIYNSLPAENTELRSQMIRMLFGACGDNIRVNQPIYVDYGSNISIGSNCLINMNCTLLDTGRITIGDNTLIGPDVKIYTAFHPLSASERYFTDEKGRQKIGQKEQKDGHDQRTVFRKMEHRSLNLLESFSFSICSIL